MPEEYGRRMQMIDILGLGVETLEAEFAAEGYATRPLLDTGRS